MSSVTEATPDAAVLAELGERVAAARIERELTQRELAAEAGIGLATLKRLEGGAAVGTDRLVRVLRALGLLAALDQLIPALGPSPLETVGMRSASRRRRVRKPVAGEGDRGPWAWGDD